MVTETLPVVSAPADVVAEPTLSGSVAGDGDVVLLLHGLMASGAYWPAEVRSLADVAQLVVVDLKGYGGSMHMPGPFGFDAQVDALEAFLRARRLKTPRVVVGHSFGSLVALAAAARWRSVDAVVAFDLPAFLDEAQARERVARMGLMARWVARRSPFARWACWLMCRYRGLFRALAPLLARDLPRDVAYAGVEHTWPAFNGTFEAIVHGARVREWIGAAACRVVVVQGRDDVVCEPALVRQVLSGLPVEVVDHAGDHQLPLRDPAFCKDVITRVLDESRSGASR